MGGYCSGPRGEKSGLNKGSIHGDGMCSYSGCISKANPSIFVDGVSVRCKKKEEVKDESKILA